MHLRPRTKGNAVSNNKPSAYFSVPDVDFKQNIRHPLSKRLRKKDNSFFAYFYNIRMPLMLPVILLPFIFVIKFERRRHSRLSLSRAPRLFPRNL